jgi:hypothetical protein
MMNISLDEKIKYNAIRNDWNHLKVQTSKTNKPFNAGKNNFSSSAELHLRKHFEEVFSHTEDR